MKFATFVLCAASLAITAGCSPSNLPPSHTDEAVKDFPKMGKALQKTPELQIKNMKTPREQADYLRGLGADSNFDPKMHKPLLEEYSKSSDPEVSTTAKDLLEKAK